MARLIDLEMGAWGIVDHVKMDGPLAERVLSLGFVPGSLVRMVRRAPLGDPVEYSVRGTRVALRRSEAARILLGSTGQ